MEEGGIKEGRGKGKVGKGVSGERGGMRGRGRGGGGGRTCNENLLYHSYVINFWYVAVDWCHVIRSVCATCGIEMITDCEQKAFLVIGRELGRKGRGRGRGKGRVEGKKEGGG